MYRFERPPPSENGIKVGFDFLDVFPQTFAKEGTWDCSLAFWLRPTIGIGS